MTPPIPVNPERLGELCRQWHITELSLFGSVLSDDFGPESDVDVLVAFEPDARVGFIGLGLLADELSQMFGRSVDLVPKAGLKPLIKDSVLSSAYTLYAARRPVPCGHRSRRGTYPRSFKACPHIAYFFLSEAEASRIWLA